MIRTLYYWLLLLHPPAFRRRFAPEMLWIFDESAASGGIFSLWVDGFVSLSRQWLLRSGSWKVAAAMGGAALEITAGGFGWLLYGPARIADHATVAQYSGRWTGTLQSSDQAIPISIVLTRTRTGWSGQVETVSAAGASHSSTAQTIRLGPASLRLYSAPSTAAFQLDARLAQPSTLVGRMTWTDSSSGVAGEGTLKLTRQQEADDPRLALMSGLLRLILCAVGPVIIMVIGVVLWFKSFTARRIHYLSMAASLN